MTVLPHRLAGLVAAMAALVVQPTFAQATFAQSAHPAYLDRLPQDETVYFLMVDRFSNGDPSNDRGGVRGDRLVTGYDPASTDFYQGGDLKGVIDHLDYIQHLGATAVWVSPIFRNQWVQGPPGHESAGYHGYWITDFTDVDPHFGTRAEFKALVDAAHARGMKVYLDIVANHTADIIKYRECTSLTRHGCPYRDKADYPYSRRGGVDGAPINPGFAGDDEAHQTAENFAKLTDPDYAYTPYLPPGTEHLKRPDWLNDIRLYHNRGDMNATAEGMVDGDFSGLDDLFTENPRVIAGFIDIYRSWIRDFHIDGYRVDTERHVDPAFWRAFAPAILAEAHADGIPNFALFGEVADPDPAVLARHTKVDAMPNDLDFAFQHSAELVLAGKQGPSALQRLFAVDIDYQDGLQTAARQPTFLGNHDMGRLAALLQRDQVPLDSRGRPIAGRATPFTRDALAKRVLLGDALLLYSRGQPILYYGDEQGMVGSVGYAGSRQTMFPSPAPAYAREVSLGATTAGGDRFNESAPLYRAIAAMTALRNAHAGLRRGVEQVVAADDKSGLYAFTRTDPQDGQYLIVMNFGAGPVMASVAVPPTQAHWSALHGACAAAVAAPGSLAVRIAPLDYIVCKAGP